MFVKRVKMEGKKSKTYSQHIQKQTIRKVKLAAIVVKSWRLTTSGIIDCY